MITFPYSSSTLKIFPLTGLPLLSVISSPSISLLRKSMSSQGSTKLVKGLDSSPPIILHPLPQPLIGSPPSRLVLPNFVSIKPNSHHPPTPKSHHPVPASHKTTLQSIPVPQPPFKLRDHRTFADVTMGILGPHPSTYPNHYNAFPFTLKPAQHLPITPKTHAKPTSHFPPYP